MLLNTKTLLQNSKKTKKNVGTWYPLREYLFFIMYLNEENLYL